MFGMGYHWQWHVIPQYIIRYDTERRQLYPGTTASLSAISQQNANVYNDLQTFKEDLDAILINPIVAPAFTTAFNP